MANFMSIHNIVVETIEVLENPVSNYEIDGIIMRLEYVVRTLVNLDSSFSQISIDEIVRLLGEVISSLQTNYPPYAVMECPLVYSGNRGRPSFEITEEKLSSLIDQGFKIPVIAQLLSISSRTIERRMSTCGFCQSQVRRQGLYLQ